MDGVAETSSALAHSQIDDDADVDVESPNNVWRHEFAFAARARAHTVLVLVGANETFAFSLGLMFFPVFFYSVPVICVGLAFCCLPHVDRSHSKFRFRACASIYFFYLVFLFCVIGPKAGEGGGKRVR